MRTAVPFLVATFLAAFGMSLAASAVGTAQVAQVAQEPLSHHIASFIVGNVLALVGGFVAAAKGLQLWLKQHVIDSVFAHNANEDAHLTASLKNHQPILDMQHENRRLLQAIEMKVDGVAQALAGAKKALGTQDAKVQELDKSLAALHTEHELIHQAQLKSRLRRRAGDPEDAEPVRVDEE